MFFLQIFNFCSEFRLSKKLNTRCMRVRVEIVRATFTFSNFIVFLLQFYNLYYNCFFVFKFVHVILNFYTS